MSRSDTLDRFGSGEQAAVNSIDDGLRGDLSTTKEAPIQALDGILATLDAVELEVDIALRVGI